MSSTSESSRSAARRAAESREVGSDTATLELPLVFINAALSSDGKLAPASRQYEPFGSRQDMELLCQLRARADAVMCGTRTVNSHPVTMGPGPVRFRRQRLRRGLAEYNLRVIVSGSGSVHLDAEVFRHRFSPIIVLTTERAGRRRLAELGHVADHVRVCGAKEIDWSLTLRWLRREWNVRCLACEGGGELNAALLLGGWVEEIYLTVCPMIFGGRDAPTLADGEGVARLANALKLELKSSRRVGDEMFLRYRVIR